MRMWKLLLMLVVAATGGTGYLVYHLRATSEAKAPTQFQTASGTLQSQTVTSEAKAPTRFQTASGTPQSQMVTAPLDSPETTIRATGNIVLPHQRILNFGVGGDIIDIKVKEGDKVKKGQPLASLDPLPLQRALAQAQAKLAEAKTPYSAADIAKAEKALQDVQPPYNLSPYTPAEVAQARAAVAAAQAQVKDAEKALQDVQPPYDLSPYTATDIAQAKATLAAAQAKVKEAENALSKVQGTLIAEDIAHLETAVADAQKALAIAQQNLVAIQTSVARNIADTQEALRQEKEKYKPIIRMPLTGDVIYIDPRILLGVETISDKLETAYQSLLKARDNARLSQEQGAKSIADAEATVTKAEDALKKAQEALARKKGDVPIDLAVRLYQMEEAKATLVKAQEDLKKRQAGPDPLEVSSRQLALENAKATLVKAQEDLKKRQAGPDPLEVSSRQLALDIAKATMVRTQEDLDRVKGSGSLADIQLREARIAAAQADYDGARDNLAKATLVAPFDGVVETIYIDKNWSVGPTTQAMLLVDPDQVQAKVAVDEIDIGRIRLGQDVRLSLDAFPNTPLKGRVSAIAHTATKQSGMLSYTVTLDVVPSADIQLREGLTTIASFVVEK